MTILIFVLCLMVDVYWLRYAMPRLLFDVVILTARCPNLPVCLPE
jgi:hypothetical protein